MQSGPEAPAPETAAEELASSSEEAGGVWTATRPSVKKWRVVPSGCRGEGTERRSEGGSRDRAGDAPCRWALALNVPTYNARNGAPSAQPGKITCNGATSVALQFTQRAGNPRACQSGAPSSSTITLQCITLLNHRISLAACRGSPGESSHFPTQRGCSRPWSALTPAM